MDRPIRSLHVSDLAEGGGAEAVFADTLRGAEHLGHDSSTLVSDGHRTPVSYVFSVRWYREMRKALRAHDPDLVHLHNYYHFLSPSVLLALRHHRRRSPQRPQVVLTAHDYHLICPNSVFQHFPGGVPTTFDRDDPKIPVFARFDQRGVAHGMLKVATHLLAYRILRLRSEIDVVISPSEHLQRTFVKAGVRAESVLIRNPVHGLAATSTPPEETSATDDSLSLVFLGRVETGKGLEEILESLETAGAAPGSVPIRLDIYGAGDASEDIGRRVGALRHVEARLMGRISRDQVPTTLQLYDALVFPSIWPENAPLTVIEAAAAGLPVLVSREKGASEMARLTEHWAELDPQDPASVARALEAVQRFDGPNRLLDPDEFTVHTFQRRLGDLYDQLVRTSSARRNQAERSKRTPRRTPTSA